MKIRQQGKCVIAGVRFVALAAPVVGFAATPASAGSTYIALGDSITFGETDLRYIPAFGDRGYVGKYANVIAARTGTRPHVINLAIDGETAESFKDATGRTPPVVGRTDAILAGQNKNYQGNTSTPQRDKFLSKVASEHAAGNSIDTVSISLGFNELAALTLLPPETALSQIDSTIATYRDNYRAVLSEVRAQAPGADLFVLNYYNPFPVDPASPAAPIFAAGGPKLNAAIAELVTEFDAKLVDTATPFVGKEAAYTFQDDMPHGSMIDDPRRKNVIGASDGFLFNSGQGESMLHVHATYQSFFVSMLRNGICRPLSLRS